MTEIETEQPTGEPEAPPVDDRHDPMMTAFVAGAMILLAVLAILIVIAAGRPPAGL